ncbi:MAG: hypothetical protein OQK24_10355 [Magnetovibrio sp.]|nr:hypothetical protein [Magnetovibrio sp.]
MFDLGKSKSEQQLATSQRKASRLRAEKEIALKEKKAQRERLRALRLAKQKAEKAI